MQQVAKPTDCVWQGKYIELDGVRLHYMERGTGQPILLAHGLGSYSYTWRHNIDALASRFRVIAVDLKGFGFSDKPDKPGYSLDAYAQSIKELIQAFGFGKVHFIGSSMGGEIGLRICLDTPQCIDKLVLIGSSGYRDRLSPWIKLVCRLPYRLGVRPFLRRRCTKQILADIVRAAFYNPRALSDEELDRYLAPLMGEAVERSFLRLLREFDFGKRKADYDQISHETLVLAGEHDHVITREDSMRLADQLQHATLHIIPKTGHFMHEERPELVNELILKFLN
ncbi:hypothetical protein BEP19_08070 [Ammoniphilus oxalaticus]|uniref:AB hydrolase-1 domain-containing protein n=1 Tax=Ammoniphilus oxalaticus TaxID=66863 RepID=A0A419SK37_9BACL|nr:alpha/beta hydrolase [Ammoniphilus oxalaticus]RKD24342.1 hypothetical protein BEP19_08070 [Ammoniphilus oxalaticus]